MEPENDLTSRILSALDDLSAEDQTYLILALISAALKSMSVYRILEIRAEIEAEMSPVIPLVNAALDVIDGQLALREISGEAAWR